MWKCMVGSWRKSSLRMVGLSLCPKLDCSSYVVSIAKTALEPWLIVWSFSLLRFLFININLPYDITWNHAWAVMSWLVLLTNMWICLISYRNVYVRLLVIYLIPLSNPHDWNKVSSSLFVSITLVDVHLNWLNWFHIHILMAGPFVILIGCMIFLSSFLRVIRMSLLMLSFLAQLDSGIRFLQNDFIWTMI